MEITNDALPWDSENIAIFRAFLQTPTGQRIIPKIAEDVPALLDGGETNAICIRAGEVRGYQKVIKALLALAVQQPELPKSDSEAYPSLEDDTKWADGEKINP